MYYVSVSGNKLADVSEIVQPGMRKLFRQQFRSYDANMRLMSCRLRWLGQSECVCVKTTSIAERRTNYPCQISDSAAQRIWGVVYGLHNMMAWLWGVAYDRIAICGRVTREAKDLPTGQCC